MIEQKQALWKQDIAPEKLYQLLGSLFLKYGHQYPLNEIFLHISKQSVLLPEGSFFMGGDPTDIYVTSWEEPRQKVHVDALRICRYPVTQILYTEVMQHNPSIFRGMMRPVDSVSWVDAILFCNRLSIKDGKTPVYNIPQELYLARKYQYALKDSMVDELSMLVTIQPQADGYRLPTEAEWEYAARGGKNYLYAGSDDIGSVAWFRNNSCLETQIVGQKRCNGFGLYDMSGNIFEWCWDHFSVYNPKRRRGRNKRRKNRCRRGGSHVGGIQTLRCSARSASHPSDRGCGGFRIVVAPE